MNTFIYKTLRIKTIFFIILCYIQNIVKCKNLDCIYNESDTKPY